jgi:hypothetical protein
MNGLVQSLKGDYMYHERLNLGNPNQSVGNLIPNIPLIIALPFPSIGDKHPKMTEILEECDEKNIPIHIDGAWISCSKNIIFDLSHKSIKSISISLSKGLGLGWNRIGLRWLKEDYSDAITIMNDFNMINKMLVIIGLHYIRNIPKDYFWNEYGTYYYKICKDFNLEPTNSIHLALKSGEPVGISPLLRYLIKNEM